MTVRRFSLIPHSRRKAPLIRSLCSFARYSSPAKPTFTRHGKSIPRGFHSTSLNRAEEPNLNDDHYKFLGVSRDAAPAQIKASFFKLSKEYHPDTTSLKDARARWEKLHDAYRTLSHVEKRQEYDLTIRPSSSPRSWFPENDQATRRKNYWDNIERQQKEEWEAAGMPHEETQGRSYKRQPGPGTSNRTRMRRERQAAGEAGSGAHAANQRPLEMGFRPRSSWDPRFAKFFDDWAGKMKQHGWDPTKTTVGGPNGPTGPEAAKLMDGTLLAQYIQYARREGKDPLGGLFNGTEGRGSAAGIWLKNRMAALDREEMKKAGGIWERGGARRGASHTSGSKRSVYSSDGASEGARAYSRNSGEETFNAPWDAVPPRGFQKDVPRPWWAAGAPPEGKDPHAYDTWNPNPKLTGTWGQRKHNHPSMLESSLYGAPTAGNESQAASGPVKRDYSKGHQLDERYEEDKLRMAAKERRMLSFVGFAVALGAVVAAGRAAA